MLYVRKRAVATAHARFKEARMKKLVSVTLACTLLVLLITQVAWAAPPEHGSVTHIVRWGESLSSIAARYGTTVYAIVQANRIANPDRIYAGQRLYIPYGGAYPPVHGVYYVVRYGDTLSSIAWRHGTSVWTIAQANGIANINMVYAGQRLYIP
jgi:LysM repeat protein